jgi:hypothetical protein
MFEDPERYPREEETDPEATGISEESPQGGGKGGIGGQGGEGEGAENLSPPIGEEGEPGRTEHSAPEEDVGVPADQQSGTEEDYG